MMRGQVSLEYLLVFGVSVSMFVFVLPVMSNARGASRDVARLVYFERLAQDLAVNCERVSLLGSSCYSVSLNYPVFIDVMGDKLVVGDPNSSLNVSVDWSEFCCVDEGVFSVGDNVSVCFGY